MFLSILIFSIFSISSHTRTNKSVQPVKYGEPLDSDDDDNMPGYAGKTAGYTTQMPRSDSTTYTG